MNAPFLVLCLGVHLSSSLYEGDSCVLNDPKLGNSKCTSFYKCDYAQRLIMKKQRPQICGFSRKTHLVCCPEVKTPEPLREKKCRDFYDVKRSKDTNVAGGEEAKLAEFPHMASLGYGPKGSRSWSCGGSLISERFILTAAHCLHTRDFGNPVVVRLGELNFLTNESQHVDYNISKLHVHPGYKTSSHYNDIALIKLRTDVEFKDNIQPACLPAPAQLRDQPLQVIGWGLTTFPGTGSPHLLKANLAYIDHKKCAKVFKGPNRRLVNGINELTQLCAGSPGGQDACPGDSGGPLHYIDTSNPELKPHFVVAGITSFGKACGIGETTGVYTRVAEFNNWIESIVWA